MTQHDNKRYCMMFRHKAALAGAQHKLLAVDAEFEARIVKKQSPGS